MSETFEKILMKDDRLGCITPKVKYQVFKGGQTITCSTFKAISETPSNHVYNVQVPSLETIISREVLWKIDCNSQDQTFEQDRERIPNKLRSHRRPGALSATQFGQCYDCHYQ